MRKTLPLSRYSRPYFSPPTRATFKIRSNPFELPQPKTGKPPKLSQSIKGTRIDLVAWQSYFVETQLLPSASDNPAADVSDAVDHFAAPLAELRAGAARPHCAGFQSTGNRIWKAALPHLKLLQDASVLLRFTNGCASGTRVRAKPPTTTFTRACGLRPRSDAGTGSSRRPGFGFPKSCRSCSTESGDGTGNATSGRTAELAKRSREDLAASLIGLTTTFSRPLGSERGVYHPHHRGDGDSADPADILDTLVEDSKMGPVAKDDIASDHRRYSLCLSRRAGSTKIRVRINQFFR